jgi:heme exporter protein C
MFLNSGLKTFFKCRNIVFATLFLLILVQLPILGWLILGVPDDYLQQETVKIMFIHVPFAWLSLGLYAFLGLLSIGYLIYKNVQLVYLIRAITSLGLLVCILALVTGAIWGKPTWGTYWVWDARLTSVLILAFIYFGLYTILSTGRSERVSVIASYFCIIGLVNLPIIKFSVDIWNTLHQGQSVVSSAGIKIHPKYLFVLFFSLWELLLICMLSVSIIIANQMLGAKISRILNKKFSSSVLLIMLSILIMQLNVKSANASAWVKDKGYLYISLSPFISTNDKSNNYGDTLDGLANVSRFYTNEKIKAYGISSELNYGFTEKVTGVLNANLIHADDNIDIFASQNGGALEYVKASEDYWILDPRIALRRELIKSEPMSSTLELALYTGTIYLGDRDYYDNRTVAFEPWFSFGRSFQKPLGLKTAPEWGTYAEIGFGPKFYFRDSKVDFSVSSEVGFKPINDKWAFIFSMDNYFSQYQPSFRPYKRSYIAGVVDDLNLSADNKLYTIDSIYNSLKDSEISDYHQLGFQIGYGINDFYTIYLKSYHNIFSSNSFRNNSYFVSLDYEY